MFIPDSRVNEKLEHPCLLYLIQIFDMNDKRKNGMKRVKSMTKIIYIISTDTCFVLKGHMHVFRPDDQKYEILMYKGTNCIRT